MLCLGHGGSGQSRWIQCASEQFAQAQGGGVQLDGKASAAVTQMKKKLTRMKEQDEQRLARALDSNRILEEMEDAAEGALPQHMQWDQGSLWG